MRWECVLSLRRTRVMRSECVLSLYVFGVSYYWIKFLTVPFKQLVMLFLGWLFWFHIFLGGDLNILTYTIFDTSPVPCSCLFIVTILLLQLQVVICICADYFIYLFSCCAYLFLLLPISHITGFNLLCTWIFSPW